MPAATLPAEVAAMAPPARHEYVEHKARERSEVQEEIKRVAADRNAFLKSKAPKPRSFDGAVQGTLRRQAKQATSLLANQIPPESFEGRGRTRAFLGTVESV